MKKNRIFLLLCCALLPALLRAQAPQERESILIISSYNPDTRRMSGFIAEFIRSRPMTSKCGAARMRSVR